MTESIHDIVSLIGKDLTNEITLQEKEGLMKWLRENEENVVFYNQIKVIFDQSSAVKNLQQFDTDAAWERVRGQLNPRRSSISGDTVFQIVWRAAAMLLIALGVGYFSYRWIISERDFKSIQSAEIALPDSLPDGTHVFLNKNSTITYSYSPVKKKRIAKLQGEAYFNIQESTQQFVLELGDVIIEDIGTTFNVEGYPGSEEVKVYVETGEVAFYTSENPGLRLIRGETGIYNRKSKSFSKLYKDNENVLAYKTKVFVFRDSKLSSVIEALNEVYDTKLELQNKDVANCRITVSFKNESIEVIAEIIAETLKLELEKLTDKIRLNGNGCEKLDD
jgi:transmembrane sensor